MLVLGVSTTFCSLFPFQPLGAYHERNSTTVTPTAKWCDGFRAILNSSAIVSINMRSAHPFICSATPSSPRLRRGTTGEYLHRTMCAVFSGASSSLSFGLRTAAKSSVVGLTCAIAEEADQRGCNGIGRASANQKLGM
ncbi:hypothetical protein SETIT_2G370600v2 [Setaria italica]|uniref:Uncharacterized protein n=1 Tax=Setaria italica TaxID=4555 RepID=A0A368Q6V1_SETIT|nr:hypothetical protein SETIT_2G370600v2 [Setaria italica]